MKKRRWHSSVPVVGLAVVVLASVGLISSARLAKADAPLCRYATSMYTVVDNETMLTWQRATDNEPYTWAEANMYCKNLNLDGTGWRLPTVSELQSIVDESKMNPAIDQAVFPFTLFVFFWSSVPYIGPSGSVWGIDFFSGNVTRNDVNGAGRVRCVR